MSTGSPDVKLRHIVVISLISFGLAGCYSNNTQAPISSVGGSSDGMSRSTDMGSQPENISGGGLISPPPSISVNQPKIVNAPSAVSRGESENVVTKNGRIVYNRAYGNIPKGSYSGQSYTVKHGDTLFYIAWITGNDFRDLAQRNNISAPYSLNVGQQLQVSNGSGGTLTGGNAVTAADDKASGIVPKPSPGQIGGVTVAQKPVITYSEDSGKPSEGKMLPSSGTNTVAMTTASVTASTVSSTTNSTTPVGSWRWPTDGKIIDNFSASEGGNKGIDIAGSPGQPVLSTASGRVVYAGNALRGYGNLIIIKHNDDYLSAYAHNDTMLVREQQEVKSGQKIATMGSTGTSSVRLHFEIRYKGKSVNPLRYLPQR
ncbi:murein hydrolase activator NlpD [Erwinia tracheiphila]|uniref:Peptidase n=1 Tax=Erwinia tracheiphila TaxID=65700 RepID=A0A0M2KDQ5_9GAMM|nr:murein hydrolase activator NlpD [Erwinia tracheiphila]EOS96031.1 lipoprotein NlpD [Erwinia tracheiphila PSU-1]KKF35353.1 peptidase [Erwinia tracheiphila]UIA87011.1 murein hydrolase activator NlpD [Erwinia tracheiphila]UIA95369.1 murein hydrolase activator NlpD [Erwinia tracheiphila]